MVGAQDSRIVSLHRFAFHPADSIVKAVAELLLIIRMKSAGEMQSDLVDEPRQMHPATHDFARTPRKNNFAHNELNAFFVGVVKIDKGFQFGAMR